MHQTLIYNSPPIFFLGLGQILGIITFSSISFGYIIATILIICTVATYLMWNRCKQMVFLFPLAFLTGGMSYYYKNYSHHSFIESISDKTLTIRATITDYAVGAKKITPLSLTLKTDQISYDQTTDYVPKYLMLYVQKPLTVQVGDRITLENVIIKNPQNPDYVRYMIKNNIAATLFVSPLAVTITPGNTSYTNSLFALREEIIDHAKTKLSPDTFYLFSSLFLGNKHEIQKKTLTPDHLAHDFKKWGLSHYLARSGLHLVIFIFLWQTLLGHLPCAYWLKQIILLLITLLYALLSWNSISFMRALATFVLGKVYYISKRRSHVINSLSLISCAFLLYNPFYLFFLDFQLSFLLTFGLAWHNQMSQWRNKNRSSID